MAYFDLSVLRTARVAVAIGLSLAVLASAAVLSPAFAQDTAAPAADAPAAPADPAAKPADAKAGKGGPNWFKICEKVQLPDPAAKDAKTAPPIEKQVCANQHESFDPQSGNLLVSVALREIEGNDKKVLLVGTPLGFILPAGIALRFDDEKDPKQLVKLGFDYCVPQGCTSESEAAPELIDRMSKAKNMWVLAVSLQGVTIPFKITMEDFATSLSGKPVDTAKYLNARKNLVLSLRERMIARQKAAQAAAAEAVKGVQEDAAAAAKDKAADPAAPKTP